MKTAFHAGNYLQRIGHQGPRAAAAAETLLELLRRRVLYRGRAG